MKMHALTTALAFLVTASAARGGPVERALAKSIDVSFAETPFESAVRYAARAAGFNLVIDRAAVSQSTLRTPVNFRIDGIPAAEVVKWLTRIAGVHYELGERALLVSSKAAIFRKKVTLQVYDVHDLTLQVADFPGMGIVPETMEYHAAPGLTLMASEGEAREITAASIAQHIMGTVKPGDWAAEYGTSVEERGGRLVVMALPEMHELIEKRLDHLRKRERRMVAFHVRAVRMPASSPEEVRPPVSPESSLGREALAKIEGAVQAEPERLLASTRFTCFNGQRTHSWGGRQTTYLMDFEISGDSYDPVVATLLRGLRAEVLPLASDDGSSIMLELKLGWTDPLKGELREFRPLGPEKGEEAGGEGARAIHTPGAIQEPRVAVTSMMTTVRMRSGSTVALAASMPDSAASGEEVVFLVTATTVTF